MKLTLFKAKFHSQSKTVTSTSKCATHVEVNVYEKQKINQFYTSSKIPLGLMRLSGAKEVRPKPVLIPKRSSMSS